MTVDISELSSEQLTELVLDILLQSELEVTEIVNILHKLLLVVETADKDIYYH